MGCKTDRFMALKEIANYQLNVLNEAEKINSKISDDELTISLKHS